MNQNDDFKIETIKICHTNHNISEFNYISGSFLTALHHDFIRTLGALRHRWHRLQDTLVSVDRRKTPTDFHDGNYFIWTNKTMMTHRKK